MKKIQLTTIIVFIINILLMTIGLILIGCYNEHRINNYSTIVNTGEENGFEFLNSTSINYILSHSHSSAFVNTNPRDTSNWIQLQTGVIFCTILTPIFALITIALIFLSIGFTIKSKNNNFWDAIKNCEIINNYYLH